MNMKKPSLVLKEKATEQPADKGTIRPKNPSANVLPTGRRNRAIRKENNTDIMNATC